MNGKFYENITVKTGSCKIQEDDPVLWYSYGNANFGFESNILFARITNLVIIYDNSTLDNCNIELLERSTLNTWPTRLAISHTTKIIGNLRLKGFNEVFYFSKSGSWPENDEYLTQNMKDEIIDLLKTEM